MQTTPPTENTLPKSNPNPRRQAARPPFADRFDFNGDDLSGEALVELLYDDGALGGQSGGA